MMDKCPVPIYHKEDNQRKGQVHHEKDNAARTVFFKFFQHFLTGFVAAHVTDEKEAHDGKGNIVAGKGIIAKCMMPKPRHN